MTSMTAGSIAHRVVVFGCLLWSLGAGAQANNAAVDQARSAFIERMVTKHDFERTALTALLADAKVNQTILDAMARPAERVAPWFEYRNIYLNEARNAGGVRFWTEHAEELETVAARYGVDPEIIVAIVGIETYFGQRMGNYRVLDALATLAFAYPPRATFFASELESFLLLGREEQVDISAALGSYAGAMGAGQFIPSSYRAYAVDANDDGRRDLWNDWQDVLGSVANYFKVHGWKAAQPVVEQATRSDAWSGTEPTNSLDLTETVGSLTKMGYVFVSDFSPEEPAAAYAYEAQGGGSEFWVGYHNFRVITRYNRSVKYALAAYQLSQVIRTRYLTAARSATE
jgi:membrane-bound lytic murein transglycosylase B